MKSKIRLDENSLKQIIKAYKEIDEVTDFLNSIYGDDWGDLGTLGSVWSNLHDIIELHVGEENIKDILKQ